MSAGIALFLGLVLLVLNSFFVGAEFSLLSARRDRLEALLESGVTRARVVIRAAEETSLMLASAQLGITLCSLGLGSLAEPAVAQVLAGAVAPLHVPGVVLHPVAFAIALIVVSVLHVLVGEMVPKNLAIAEPERLALWLVPVFYGFVKLVRPLTALFNAVSNGVLRLLRVEPKDELETAYTSAELAELIGESRREGLLDQAEHRRLTQTLSSVGHTVGEVLVPLTDVTTLPVRATVGDIEQAVTDTGFSRFPVPDSAGRLIGYLHIKDVLDLTDGPADTTVPRSRVHNLPTMPADARLDEALAALRRAHSHLATAVDASGVPVGLIALEDLVEEYVGTVRDATHVG